ncbi:lipopolysaccharide/colanic/teichoic acid biosynthesis glycosyltransferase [Palleronia aestuarii]|uniref:Lipopolysaccharide/colanic/teichoic acid biosynthesis glycosyltransferase n=1 Tax=Palleronia aestuarii TaxID=568105 RepID=A0A2W7N057_9RHOB|nr:sugar transferase [Palleronia aestuarii]PZX13508.1 lipopolysaccharide/colanic/teichoic acid biosynthesis glycosyltransferase [Palleronia aestuarii]
MTAQDTHLAAFYGPVEPSSPQKVDDAQPRSRSGGGAYRAGLKRIFDSALVLLAAPIVLPILGVLILLVARDGGNPFYFQDRIGRAGRVYRMWKLRTMVTDADACLETHLSEDPTLREEWNTKQKLLDDPRITPLGRVLRKCSLDELPQLWNVLTGDMSLVGPRPMMVCQKDLYPGEDYYDLRPGITGPWQISDRNHTDFVDRAGYDAGYNASLSFSKDLQILTSTVRVVLRGTGY